MDTIENRLDNEPTEPQLSLRQHLFLTGLVTYTFAVLGFWAYSSIRNPPPDLAFRNRPNWVFHGDIGGEHIAFYGGHGTQYWMLEVNKSDGSDDVHPTIDSNQDIVMKFLTEGGVRPISKRQTRVYLLDAQGRFLEGAIVQNSEIVTSIKDKQWQKQADSYLAKFQWAKPK